MNILWWKKIHNVLGLAASAFLLLLLATGILLNHPGGMRRDKISALAIHPDDPRQMLQGKADGLYSSDDGGEHWNEVPMLYAPKEVVDIRFNPKDSRRIFVLEKWGRIFHSADGGKIWDRIELPFDPQSEGIELEQLSVGEKDELAVLTSHGWIYSANAGKDWDADKLKADKPTLYRTIQTLHNGYFFGPYFVWLYDFAAVALLVLIISGIILWKTGKKLT